MIRITGGENRSRLLETPNATSTKPTMDRVREGVFSALGEVVIHAKVLDLFAGSGSYGFESLSRGAEHATFVESNYDAVKVIRRNAHALNRENICIEISDVLSFLSGNHWKFDIIFADPPYKLEVYEEMVKLILEKKILNDNGIIVLESERELNIDESKFKKVKIYNYGLAKIYILRT